MTTGHHHGGNRILQLGSPLSDRASDTLLALGVAVFGLVGVSSQFGDGETASVGVEHYGLIAGGFVAILLRRRHPLLVLVVVAGCRIALRASVGNDAALAPAAMIALYTVARSGDRRKNVTIAVLAAIGIAAAVARFDDDAFLPEFLADGALMLLPVAVADAARSRSDRLRALIDREANERVSAERLRIARDLHDVVAHGLSVIAVQSGVGAHLIDKDPQQAKLALETINETGKSTLEELRGMVGMLRSTDDVPLRPTPTDPNDLSELIENAAHAGVTVTVTTVGEFPSDIGDACSVAVHRIVQEALTNVARHAGAVPVSLLLEHASEKVRVSIVNEPGTTPEVLVASTGVGIVGMTERAVALGGTLTAEPTAAGGFQVTATIPYGQRRTPPVDG